MPSEKMNQLIQLDNAFANAVSYRAPKSTLDKIQTQKKTLLEGANDAEKYEYYRHKAVLESGMSLESFDRQVTEIAGNEPSKKLAHTLTYLSAVASMSPVGIFGNLDLDLDMD